VSETGPSLRIGFGDAGGIARLSASHGYEDDLHRLMSRFRTASLRARGSADVAIDDLLVNLVELAGWRDPDGVTWDPDLRTLARDTTLDAQIVEKQLHDGLSTNTEVSPEEIPDVLGSAWVGGLASFQRRDISRLLSLHHGANFSVPGAGKTRVGLAVFQAFRRKGLVQRLLIVGPKSCYEAWQSENVGCFADPLRMQVFNNAIYSEVEALIVNYERLQGSLNALVRWVSAQPSLVILDEAHRMKLGAGGAYGAACLALGPRARRRLILTGTPAPNGARDLENLLGFVWPGHGRRAVSQAVAGGDLVHASRVLRPLFTRTTKLELGLPPAPINRRDITLPPLHREIYDALLGHYSARASTSQDDFHALGKIVIYLLMAAINPALLAVGTTRYEPLAYQVPPLAIPKGSHLLELMRDLPSYEMSPKYREVLAIVAENVAIGRKTLVWSTFIRSLTTLEKILKEFSPAVVHGGTEDREGQLNRFQNDGDCMVLLSNPATLGEGISLHHDCHDAIYVDRDFAAGRFLQSLDRIHRLGLPPDTRTRITVLSGKETIDEVVNQRLEVKLNFMGRILDDPAVQQLADLEEEPAVGGGLDQRDLQALMGHLRVDPA
jgi:SNF2-related domain/Helicase conserved C-terminal domain